MLHCTGMLNVRREAVTGALNPARDRTFSVRGPPPHHTDRPTMPTEQVSLLQPTPSPIRSDRAAGTPDAAVAGRNPG
ncbi:hypothetical protein [Sphaerisporangium aureirubrum]|uniref:Uncharacterized protein n=1 Tax=Sphaerisporangium aureirubrum TaxID=1544736 RepID=A0ABW1NW23_9ACTN